MYAGMVDLDVKTESSMFYWYFVAPKPDYSKRLVLWFTGGPGDAGQESIFDENGPLKFRTREDNTTEVYSDIENSFVAVADVIYVDQPLGVGYSTTHENVTEGEQYADAIVEFLLKFYEIHPDQRLQELIVAGNSYAGHYVPRTAKAILDHNKKANDNNKINLKAIIAEGGYVDPINQRLSIKDLNIGAGLATLDILSEYEILEQKCEQSLYLSPDSAFSDCKAMNRLMFDTNGGWDIMDIRYPLFTYLSPEKVYESYFKSETVQKQLHVISEGEETIPYTLVNDTIYHNIRFDGLKDYTKYYDEIVTSGVFTLVHTASFDGLDGTLGTQRWMNNLNFTNHKMMDYNEKSIYYYKTNEGEEKVGGSFKLFEDESKRHKLFYASVYNAGHQIGNSQLTVSKSMLYDMVAYSALQCHQTDGNCKPPQNMCSHMNECSNQGT